MCLIAGRQDAQAFKYLKRCADEQAQPYIYYCLACLYKNGRGIARDYDRAVAFYVKAIKAGADVALKNEITLGLNDIADTGHLVANCELLLITLDNQESYKTVLKIVDAYWNKEQSEQESLINYLFEPERYQYIEKVAKQGNVGAIYLLSALHALKDDDTTDTECKFCEGIAYLIHPKSRSLDDKAFEFFIQALSVPDTRALDKKFLDCAVPGSGNVVTQITERIKQGDQRFIVVLLRLALVFGMYAVDIDQQTAITYFNTAVENNLPGIDSLAAYLYRNGVWVEKSEEKALACYQKVLDNAKCCSYLYDGALNELLGLAANDSRLGVMARYIAVVHLVKRGPSGLNTATKLFRQAEMSARDVVQDKELHEFAHTSGAWDAMLSVAKMDDETAAFMGVLYAARIKYEAGNAVRMAEIETIGMPLLEKVRGKSDSLDDLFISKAYVALADAWCKSGADWKKCTSFLERAIAVKPDNAGALHRLAIYYKDAAQTKGGNTKSYATKSFQFLMAAARLKDSLALMDLAVAYMPDACSLFVTQGIIKPSVITAIHYLHEILGDDPLQNIECIKKDVYAQKPKILALILLAKLHIVKNLSYTEKLMPHLLSLFPRYQQHVAQLGPVIDEIDRVTLREGYYLMGLWSIKQKQWDSAITYMKKFDDAAGPSIESVIQRAMCHMKKSILVTDSELKKKCYHDVMDCMREVIRLGAIERGVFVNGQVGMLFAQILEDLKVLESSDRYVHTIVQIIAKSLIDADFSSKC